VEANEISEQITALVDNELKDQDDINRLKDIIKNDSKAGIEFYIETNLKNLVKNRVPQLQAPIYLRNRIVEQIKDEIASPKRQTSRRRWYEKLLLTPKYAIALVTVILAVVLSVVVLITNKNSSKNNNSKNQNPIYNMLAEARKNFQKISEGKLPLQLSSNSPETVKRFFKQKGVKFDPIVPDFKDWELLGAVVSDQKGEKLPHNLYKCKDGKLVYLYQADEHCLKNKVVSLSSDISKIVDDGKYYKVSDGEQSALIWKHKGKICVVVSNGNINTVESKFLAEEGSW
jgi:type II secretory pathway pseudopilin PulG